MMFKNKKRSIHMFTIIFSFAIATPLCAAQEKTPSIINVDGESTQVYFNDGDTFKILDGEFKGSRVRVGGFNALESYGPVHEWFDNTTEQLYKISKLATEEARKGGWNCKLEGGSDAYGRLLANCDDLAFELLRKGLAHAYSANSEKAKRSYLSKQKMAQKEGLGMWAGGVPKHIISSLHSASEGHKETYNRLISTKDGSTLKMQHEEEYETCQKVCVEDGRSCMVFVPFNERYGKNRPTCLYVKSHGGGKYGSNVRATKKN